VEDVNAGIIDESVEPPESAERLSNRRFGITPGGYIHLDEERAGALLLKPFRHSGAGLGVFLGDNDGGAFAREAPGDRCAYAPASAGHQGDLVLQPSCHQ
jgi:hypothetical protein